ncbi:MAG: hypothetical protein JO100_04880 [Pseudonocardia sp.]|nr:hypothetical protein [Pseudonocardia sp.]
MSSLKRSSHGHYLLPVVAAASVIAAAGWLGHAGSALSDDSGGLGISDIGDGVISCGVKPSDPRQKKACNHSGGNGSNGSPGEVRQNGGDDAYGSSRG